MEQIPKSIPKPEILASDILEKLQKLPDRETRLKYRDDYILTQLHSGTSKQEIADSLSVSLSLIYKILTRIEENSKEYFKDVIEHAKGLIASNNKKYLLNIVKLEELRSTIGVETDEGFDKYVELTKIINQMLKEFNSMIQDTLLVEKVKELEDKIESEE